MRATKSSCVPSLGCDVCWKKYFGVLKRFTDRFIRFECMDFQPKTLTNLDWSPKVDGVKYFRSCTKEKVDDLEEFLRGVLNNGAPLMVRSRIGSRKNMFCFKHIFKHILFQRLTSPSKSWVRETVRKKVPSENKFGKVYVLSTFVKRHAIVDYECQKSERQGEKKTTERLFYRWFPISFLFLFLCGFLSWRRFKLCTL